MNSLPEKMRRACECEIIHRNSQAVNRDEITTEAIGSIIMCFLFVSLGTFALKMKMASADLVFIYFQTQNISVNSTSKYCYSFQSTNGRFYF